MPARTPAAPNSFSLLAGVLVVALLRGWFERVRLAGQAAKAHR